MEAEKKESLGYGVRCDACESRFVPRFSRREENGLEITVNTCPFCEKEYLVAVTDEELRKNISAYASLAARNRRNRLTEEEQRSMQALKSANVERARELMQQYTGGEDHDGKQDD